MEVEEALAGVALVAQGVDALLAAPLPGTGAELSALIEELETQRRRLEAVDQRVLAEAEQARLAGEFGQPALADVLCSLLRIDVPEARRRIARADALGPRRTLTGEPLEALMPATAQAAAEGAVSPEQADVIIKCLDHIPDDAPAAAWPVAERLLLEAARHEHPKLLRRTAAELLARLDPDGLEPAEDEAERRRGFTLIKNPDGTSTPRGSWTAELTAYCETLMDSLAAPQPVDDQPDTRSAAQRRHDALLELFTRVFRSGSLPAAGGIPITVLATTTIGELAAAAGVAPDAGGTPPMSAPAVVEPAATEPAARTGRSGSGMALLGHGQLISAKKLLAMACEARIVPVIFNDAGGVLAYGRGTRLATTGQRLALVARDGGCSFPGCERPAAWTEVHHVIPHVAHGPTAIDNMCLLCRWHHHNFEKNGWVVRMSSDGLPEWLPPPWLDPTRTPRRNTVHHRPDFDFRLPNPAA